MILTSTELLKHVARSGELSWANLSAKQRVVMHWLITEGLVKVTSRSGDYYCNVYVVELTDKGCETLFLIGL